MPILAREPDLFPDDLLDRAEACDDLEEGWWALYTSARREKALMRKLHALSIPHYGPTIRKLDRSPSGRLRESFVPLFPSYVFLFGTENHRYHALTTNCVSRAF